MKKVIFICAIILPHASSLLIGRSITSTLGGGKAGIGATTLAELLNVNGSMNLGPAGEIKLDQTTAVSDEREIDVFAQEVEKVSPNWQRPTEKVLSL